MQSVAPDEWAYLAPVSSGSRQTNTKFRCFYLQSKCLKFQIVVVDRNSKLFFQCFTNELHRTMTKTRNEHTERIINERYTANWIRLQVNLISTGSDY